MEKTANFSLDQFYGLSGILQEGEFYLHIRELIFNIKHLGATRRAISHWASFGMFDYPRDQGRKWRKFSFVELVWVQIIRQLREFGYPLEKILLVRKELMTYFTLENLLKGITQRPEVWEDTKAILNEDAYDQLWALADAIDNGLNEKTDDDEAMLAKMDLIILASTTTLNPLQILITNCLKYKISVSLLVFADGSAFPESGFPDMPLLAEWEERKESEPYIRLSLTNILRDFLTEDKNLFSLPQLGILTEKERKLLEIISSGEYDQVVVKFRDKEMDALELTKTQDVKRKIVNVLQDAKYQDITVKRHDGQITLIENTTKMRF